MKKILKFGCLGIIVVVVLLTIIGMLATKDIPKTPVTTGVSEVNKDETQKETTDKDVLEKQKEYYLNNTKPRLEELIEYYDRVWDEGWRPTFEALSKSNVDMYSAYQNFKLVNKAYRELNRDFQNIPIEGLSEEQQKVLTKGFRELGYSAIARQLAAEKAMDMIDKNNFSPSLIDKIMNDVSTSDAQMMTGAVLITTVEMELGLVEEEKQE